MYRISNAFIFKLERKILEIENKVNSNMFKMKQEFDSFWKYIISLISKHKISMIEYRFGTRYS